MTDKTFMSYRARAYDSGWRPRRLIAVAVLAAIVLALFLPWRNIRMKVAVLYWQRQCMHKTVVEKPVYVSRSLSTAREIAGAPMEVGYYLLPRPTVSGKAFTCWQKLKTWAPNLSSSQPESPVFVHQRSRPDGQVRLVAVNLIVSEQLRIGRWAGETIDVSLNFRTQVLDPATVSKPLREVGSPSSSWGIAVMAKDHVRAFTGQPDSNDPSRLTVKYDVDGKISFIEIKLLDDDTVEIQRIAENPTTN